MHSSRMPNISSLRPASIERQWTFAGAPPSLLLLPDGCCGMWRHGIPRSAAAAAAAAPHVRRSTAAAGRGEWTVNCVAAAVQQTDVNAPFVGEHVDAHALLIRSSSAMPPRCSYQVDALKSVDYTATYKSRLLASELRRSSDVWLQMDRSAGHVQCPIRLFDLPEVIGCIIRGVGFTRGTFSAFKLEGSGVRLWALSADSKLLDFEWRRRWPWSAAQILQALLDNSSTCPFALDP